MLQNTFYDSTAWKLLSEFGENSPLFNITG